MKLTPREMSLILVICLIGATPCGAGPPIGDWIYGLPDPGPRPAMSISQNGGILSVSEGFGDRMFTGVRSTYDAATLNLLTSNREANCCGEYWKSTIRRNDDGTYDIEAETDVTPTDVLTESRPHYQPYGRPIIAGMLLLTPWVYHKTHSQYVLTVVFDPLQIRDITISEVPAAPYPDDVPSGDLALKLTSFGQPSMTVWYDPCTFIADAYGRSADYAQVRSSLIHFSHPR